MHERVEAALFFIKEGYTAKEIVELCGYANTSSVRNLASYYGLTIQKPCVNEHAEMRKYKAEGHSIRETAIHFQRSISHTQKICRGIAPQPNFAHNKGTLQDLDNVLKIISERAPGFEYAGNYTGSAGHVDLRCKKCGDVHTHGWHGIRHKGVKVCPNCLRIEREERKAEIAEQKAQAEAERKAKAEQKEREAEARRKARIHPCPVCGTLTDRKKYCSDKCRDRVTNAKKEVKRRAKIQDAMVDKNISLERLYRRDRGVCHICGGQCNWNDHEYRGRFFIAGREYPTIDHVVPLVLGGKHSWTNVKLAHLSCNSAKGASVNG